MSTSLDTISRHISSMPGVLGGKPCIAGTRIGVQDIYVWHELLGQSVDQIVGNFPQLTHADIYAALAFFWDHRDEVLAQMAAGDKAVEELKRRFPSKLGAKLRDQGDADQISS